MLLNREQIAALIPHGEAMCMLDEVVAWDDEQIRCRSSHFARGDNPLFEEGQLHTVLLLEYAAQAAAVHAALLQSRLGEQRPAYIGAVKSVEILKPVSDNRCAIDIEAHCLLNNSSGAIYEVLVYEVLAYETLVYETLARQQGDLLLRGRLILNQP